MACPSPPPLMVHQSDDSSPGTQKTLVATKLLSNALLLSSSSCSSSSSFRHFTPLLLLNQQPSYPKFNVHVPTQVAVAERLFRDFHKSVVSAADGCLGFVQSFASKSSLFDKLFSLPSHFRNFSQIHQKNYRNLNCLSKHNFGAILPGDSVAGLVVANGIINFLNIYNTLLVVRLVLTWFPNSPPVIVSPLRRSETFPNFTLGWVNVKDVANAHVQAFEIPSANGRYCIVESVVHYSEIVKILHELYPDIQLPEKCADDNPYSPTYQISSEKANSLGIDYIPFKESVKETVVSLKEKTLLSC